MGKVIDLQSRKKSNINKYLLFFAFVLAIIFILISRIFQIKNIDIIGNERYTEQEILNMLKITNNTNLFNIYLNNENSIKNFPYLNKVDVKIEGVNKILIIVEEKQIIGYFPFMGKYLCIDEDGYIVDYTSNVYEHVPIIKGINIDSFIIGEKIEVSEEIIKICLMFYENKEKYNIPISEIEYDESTDSIILYINKIKVFFGTTNQFYKKIILLSEIIPQISEYEEGILDLRYNLDRIVFQKKYTQIEN